MQDLKQEIKVQKLKDADKKAKAKLMAEKERFRQMIIKNKQKAKDLARKEEQERQKALERLRKMQ